MPSKKNEDREGRPVEFDREAYRRRNVVERLIGRQKEFRRVFSRFDKTALNFWAANEMVALVSRQTPLHPILSSDPVNRPMNNLTYRSAN